jgi:hypothetical protein
MYVLEYVIRTIIPRFAIHSINGMDQAVSCPDCYSGGLRSIPVGPVDVGFMDNKVVLGQVFLRVLRLTAVNVIPLIPIAHWDEAG